MADMKAGGNPRMKDISQFPSPGDTAEGGWATLPPPLFFGLRRHDCAFLNRDASLLAKAASCGRTPKFLFDSLYSNWNPFRLDWLSRLDINETLQMAVDYCRIFLFRKQDRSR